MLILSSNPVDFIKIPPMSKARQRRLNQGEYESLEQASHITINPTADLKATAALGCLTLLRCSALRMISMILPTSFLASVDAGGLVRLM
jgi:hypothetical protein